MKFRFPIVIIDEDYRSENTSGLGIRARLGAGVLRNGRKTRSRGKRKEDSPPRPRKPRHHVRTSIGGEPRPVGGADHSAPPTVRSRTRAREGFSAT